MKFHVYGIGNAIVDLQIEGTDADIAELGVEKGSMNLVDEARQKSILDYIQAASINHSSGGAGANSIIALQQLGGHAAYGCIVGDDERGQFYLEELQTLGVTVQNAPLPGKPTGTSVVIITPDGERTMNTHLGATAEFAMTHVNEDLLAKSEWLFIEGYLFATDLGREAVRHAVALAKKHNVKILLTLGASFVPEVFREPVMEAAEQSDLIICNADEARTLAGVDDDEKVFELLEKTGANVVMTRSEEGAWIYWEGQTIKVSAFPTTIVDSTGAGDAFAGSFLYGITHGMSPKDAGHLGCFIASKVVAQLGARLRLDAKELLKEMSL